MQHVLDTLHTELERTHDLVEHYKYTSFKEIFFSLFWKGFKKILLDYGHAKEAILMKYATLHYDIQKDIKNSEALPTDVEHVRLNIMSITDDIEICSGLMQQLISHSQKQEDILHHEKLFFVNLIESFNADLLEWVESHEKEIFWEVSHSEKSAGKNSLESSKMNLELQKKKLESHIESLTHSENTSS